MRNRPSASVVAVRELLVDNWMAVITAPARLPPDGSRTTPTKSAVVGLFCAMAGLAVKTTTTSSHRTRDDMRVSEGYPNLLYSGPLHEPHLPPLGAHAR